MAHSGTVVFMCTVPGKPKQRELTAPLPLVNMDGTMGEVPTGFRSDGASVGLLAPLFPRHNHPIATFRHDYRCAHAKTPAERLFADSEFRKDVDRTSWKITSIGGYAGVRVGAMLGIGVKYRHPLKSFKLGKLFK